MELEDFIGSLQEEIADMGGDVEVKDGIISTLITDLGVNRTNVILEALIEGAPNGEDLPYPVLRFHYTLAKDIEPEKFKDVTYSLNELNTVINSGEFPSFGGFGLYMPFGQIYLTYRMPINLGNLETELENARFFLGTLYEQLDLFVDMVLYIAEGNELINVEKFIEYLRSVEDIYDLKERADKLGKVFEDQQ